MAENSAIEWTDHTFNPWMGCTKVGPGCDHCYAESMNRWLRKGENWGPGAPRRTYSADHWDKPLKWNRAAAKAGKSIKVFPSVCDPFDNAAPPAERERFWNMIDLTPNLTWLLLTKRIGNAMHMMPKRWIDAGGARNVWLGATIVNQEEADRDIWKLLETPARVRFLSCEPLLEYVTVFSMDGPVDVADGMPSPIHWVIAGGESGRGARPAHPDWFRNLRDQCAAVDVPFLFKQHGEHLPVETEVTASEGHIVTALEGMGELPDGRHRVITLHGAVFARIGKKAAGRLLDGRTHDEFPEVA